MGVLNQIHFQLTTPSFSYPELRLDSKLFDRLRATATVGKECSITYRNENNDPTEVQGRIVDVYSSDDGEWCKMIDDTVIRLDRIENFELN